MRDPIEVSGAVGEYPIGGDIARKRMSEEISVADEHGPGLDADGDSVIGSISLGKIARGDPESFDSQANDLVVVARGLAARKNLEELIEREQQRVQRVVGGHSSRASRAPGTSSVMTRTYSPTI